MYQRARHGLGYLPQDDSIFGRLTVEENLLAILEFLESDRSVIQNRIDDLLQRFGLDDKQSAPYGDLSGGQKGRLGLARRGTELRHGEQGGRTVVHGLRHDHDPQRRLLQVRQLRQHERLQLGKG